MKKYKLSNEDFVIDQERKCFIPINLGNVDYIDYLKWIESGNEPDEKDLDPEITIDEKRRVDILDAWPIYNQLEALTENENGRPEKLNLLLSDIDGIKTKYPKN
jgi:hypothetical protein